jgi:hypothetical protein
MQPFEATSLTAALSQRRRRYFLSSLVEHRAHSDRLAHLAKQVNPVESRIAMSNTHPLPRCLADCSPIAPQLSNFYQNHRRYVKSYDRMQMLGCTSACEKAVSAPSVYPLAFWRFSALDDPHPHPPSTRTLCKRILYFKRSRRVTTPTPFWFVLSHLSGLWLQQLQPRVLLRPAREKRQPAPQPLRPHRQLPLQRSSGESSGSDPNPLFYPFNRSEDVVPHRETRKGLL